MTGRGNDGHGSFSEFLFLRPPYMRVPHHDLTKVLRIYEMAPLLWLRLAMGLSKTTPAIFVTASLKAASQPLSTIASNHHRPLPTLDSQQHLPADSVRLHAAQCHEH